MSLTPSTMLELDTPLPSFRLPDYDGRMVSDRDLPAASALLVAFICPHCPYVKHIRQALSRFAADYQPRGLSIVAINSNDAAQFPDDSPAGMRQETAEAGYTFPYLVDEDQAVARTFRAACTPDFYLFDGRRRLVYRGQFDASRPKSGVPATGADLRAAADALLGGQPIAPEQRPSVGCNIKWKRGSEPAYFTA
jgi:thiol-disulfide isomerase/thioredoxin